MQILLTIFFLSAGLMLFVGVQSLFLAAWGVLRTVNVYFGLLCIAAASYQFFSGLYYQAATLDSAMLSLHRQLVSLAIFLPMFTGFVGAYTGDKRTPYWTALAAVYAVTLVLVDTFSEHGIRFSQIYDHGALMLSWGETLKVIHGKTAAQLGLVSISGIVMTLWCFYRALVLKQRQDSRKATIFFIYVGIFLFSVIYGVLSNHGVVPHFFVVGFGFLGLTILMAGTIAVDVRSNVLLLAKQRAQLLKERTISRGLKRVQERLSQVVEQSPHGVYLFDCEGCLLQRNTSSRQLIDDAIEYGDNFFLASPWKLTDLHDHFLTTVLSGNVCKKTLEIPAESLPSKNRSTWLNITLFPVSEADGCPDVIALICEDNTRSHYIDMSLKVLASGVSFAESSEFFKTVAFQIAELFQMRNAMVARIVSSGFTTLAVCKDGQVQDNFSDRVEQSFCERIVGRDVVSYRELVQKLFPDDKLLAEWGAESLIAKPLLDGEGNLIGFIAAIDSTPNDFNDDSNIIFDIIADRTSAELQRQDAEHRIRRMAYEDYITRLPNRARLNEYLSDLVRDCTISGCQAAAYFLDIDHFKTINDALGHDIGDDVLRRIGSRLRSNFDEELIVARMGGDEFVLLERITDGDLGEQAATQLAKNTATKIIDVMSRPLSLGNRILSLGASVGVVLIPLHADSETSVMGRADIALYEAKQSGRNRFELYDPAMQENVDERLKIEKGLRIALEREQFEVFYQPRVDSNGKVSGAEALLRWNHPEYGFISPAKFIPVAEETGLIHLVGDWVIAAICKDVAQWRACDKNIDFDISVNISAWQFAKPEFAEYFMGTIASYGLSKKHISIEMTETAILRDINETKKKLSVLQRLGFRIYLDDFGTGFSSLSYLKDLPLDAFKIDRSFVVDIENPKIFGLLQSMIAIGRHMNLAVTAEGVETETEFQRLLEMGCEHFQGFLFGRPMPANEFVMWVENNLDAKR